MTRILLGLTALTLVGANVREDDNLRLPAGPQPLQVLARVHRDGVIVIRQTVPVYREEVRQRTVQQDGRPVVVTYKVAVPTQKEVTRKLTAKNVRVYGTDGKKIDSSGLQKLLKKETAVLLSMDGKMVDPFYLRLIREGTLILVHPQGGAGPGPLPEPIPEPKRPERKMPDR